MLVICPPSSFYNWGTLLHQKKPGIERIEEAINKAINKGSK
jgi:hypothetical protein